MKRFFLLIPLIFFLFNTVSAQTVYVTKSGKKYHSSGCSYLKSSIPLDLENAINRGYTPCSRCSPPTTTTTSESKSNLTEKEEVKKEQTTTQKKSTTTSSRCLATTKKGTQCKRNAAPGSNYCWQHK